MKIKKTSIFSLVLAVALIVGVTTVFATSAFASSAKESEKQVNLGLELTPFSNEQITKKSINVADGNNSGDVLKEMEEEAEERREERKAGKGMTTKTVTALSLR